MSNLTCPGCGSVYPLAAVQKFDSFPCAVCHQTIVVPIAGPAAARAAPPPQTRAVAPPVVPSAPPPIPYPAAPHRPAAGHPPRHHHAPPRHAAPDGPNWALIGTGVAVFAAAVVGTLLVVDKSGPPPPPAPAVIAKPATPAPPPAAKADPAKDPAAWKALPADERADRTLKYLAALDRNSGSALSSAYTFLKARDEADAVRKVAELELARDPSTGWAHQARGDAMVGDRVDRCLAECVRADEADTPGVQRLAKLRKAGQPESGMWWANAAQQSEVDALIAQIRAEEKTLQDPYEWACAKWQIYQRRIEVMRDHPAVTGTAGPYLIFVQVKAPVSTPIETVPEIEMNRAKRVLNQNKTLFSAFYDGFHEAFGKALGVARYDKTNLDDKTLLKANIFADDTTWELYHQRLGFLPSAVGVRAYYQADEPRFVVSYDPGGEELSSETDQVQCHEATHQLVHFYTWDVSRKLDGRELAWSQCNTRPLWVEEGFAEFFSSHRREGGRYLWMQPLENRMEALWVFSQVFAKKRWAMWSIDELLAIVDQEQVVEQAAKRVVPKPLKQITQQQAAERTLAVDLFRPVFYAKSWSLVSFLWNQTDAAGRFPYRDKFAAFLKDSLPVKQVNADGRGLKTRVLAASDFRKALALDAEDRFRAFEKEWLAWEAGLLEKSKKNAWTVSRDNWFGRLGLK